jgi:hypothetical protein
LKDENSVPEGIKGDETVQARDEKSVLQLFEKRPATHKLQMRFGSRSNELTRCFLRIKLGTSRGWPVIRQEKNK